MNPFPTGALPTALLTERTFEMKTDLLNSIIAALLAGVVLLPVTLPKPASADEGPSTRFADAGGLIPRGQP